jgi:hypothetical protein
MVNEGQNPLNDLWILRVMNAIKERCSRGVAQLADLLGIHPA